MWQWLTYLRNRKSPVTSIHDIVIPSYCSPLHEKSRARKARIGPLWVRKGAINDQHKLKNLDHGLIKLSAIGFDIID